MDTKRIESLLEILIEGQAEMLQLLREQGITVKREYSKNIYSEPMSQEEKNDLDEEIDLDWWFLTYGEEFYPAKYMDRQKLGYTKRELDYMHKRLAEIADCKPEVNCAVDPETGKSIPGTGTHIFVNVGKKYCKAEKNSLNCFACVPKEQE